MEISTKEIHKRSGKLVKLVARFAKTMFEHNLSSSREISNSSEALFMYMSHATVVIRHFRICLEFPQSPRHFKKENLKFKMFKFGETEKKSILN